MSVQPLQPGEARSEFVDSPFRCHWCGKRMVVDIHDNERGPHEVHVCLDCGWQR
jgi:predicted RNA-binding Zn-ribbon protein involved in translation (DUF1610 family)